MRGSVPRQVDKKSSFPKEERGVWGSQRGDRCLEFSRRRKDKDFSTFLSLSHIKCFFFFKPGAVDYTTKQFSLNSVQFSSVTQPCPALCDPMDCSIAGFSVHHQFLELAQTHVCQVGDAFQPSHPLLSPSPSAFNLSQHQGLFKSVSSLHQVSKVLVLRLQHQSFQ